MTDRAVGYAMRLVKSWVYAQAIVLLLFGPYLANLTTPAQLRLRFWTLGHAVLLLALLFSLAVTIVGIREGIGRLGRPWLQRVLDHLFVVAVVGGLLANFAFYLPIHNLQGLGLRSVWLLLIALIAYSLVKSGARLPRYARQGCLILAPLTLILPVRLLMCQTYGSQHDPLPTTDRLAAHAGPIAVGGTPVYLFVFDMWSYARTFDDGALQPEFVNLTALAGQSIVFHEAHSPGPQTWASLPPLLLDTPCSAILEGGAVEFDCAGRRTPASHLPSIFGIASTDGYQRYLVGFYLPYRLILGDRVDICRSYPWCEAYPGDTWLEQAEAHVIRAARYWTDPWFSARQAGWQTRLNSAFAIRIQQAVTEDALYGIRQLPERTFMIVHCPSPHFPYVLTTDGRPRDVNKVSWALRDPAKYEQALLGMDALIGQLVAAMKDAGRFDNALVVLTADHEWRYDPRRSYNADTSLLTHVPLLVKLPHQDRSASVATSFETRNLRLLIERVLDGSLERDGLDGFLARLLAESAAVPQLADHR